MSAVAECMVTWKLQFLSLTIQIQLVYPSSAPPGSLIELAGSSLPGSIYTYERLYVGDLECDHIDSSSGLPYGVRWYRSKRHAKCQVHNQLPGAYNTSIQFRDWAGRYGASWNDSSAMYLMFDGSLGMFEVFPGEWISGYLAIGVKE